MSTFGGRVIRAMKLDKDLFEEVEADRTATGQAMAVVILASVAGGIGGIGLAGLKGMLLGSLAALAGWVVWSFITFVVGTKILPTPQTRSDMGELLRTLGFAQSAALFSVLGAIPALAWFVRVVVPVWVLIAWVIAVRQALDYTSTGRAVAVCLIGWVFYLLALFFILFLQKGFAAVPGMA